MARSVQIDPTDDFNFTPKAQLLPVSERSIGMSVRQVQTVLAERLDLVPLSQVPALARQLVYLCHYYHFDPAFILSIIQAESGFRVKAVSPVGAVGLMQLMPATAAVILRDRELPLDDRFQRALRSSRRIENHLQVIGRRLLMVPTINITLGVRYLATLRDHYQGLSQDYLLAAYNMGPARVDELLAQRNFRPYKPAKYLKAIRQGVSQFRTYKETALKSELATSDAAS